MLYPEVGFTRGQVIEYYTRAAPYVLPHLHGPPDHEVLERAEEHGDLFAPVLELKQRLPDL